MMPARANPFRIERVLRVRYRPRGVSWPALMSRLAAMDYRGAIVGPHGSGKTTLLEDIAARLEAAGMRCRWMRLEGSDGGWGRSIVASGDAELTTWHPADGVTLIDGADTLGWMRWRWLRWRLSRARGIIITSHRPGLLPTLIECTTDAALLASIVDELREPTTWLPEQFPLGLYDKHHGNLREALRELYDLQSA